ncbi:hypothetical protein [Herbaspirillum sp. SJZ107]|uniref:hypothetical protein n=1 Tax=Herbaspirillum sp. SJZ107 TaxID=2572881 RepID=UPI001154B7AE|nr:hypothetical protein [Herbaspirillum sp. SJZ107]TQK08263.1 hypothetical protein FBX97_3579 [Herbaspirillum sp. SJZ107]
MVQYLIFQCVACNAVVVGPEAPPPGKPGPEPGKSYAKRPGLACPTNLWHASFKFTGTETRPPKAPPMAAPGVKQMPLPSKWEADGDGKFVKTLRYADIPEAAQRSLIAELEPTLGDSENRIPLLGASFDRFDRYGDADDVAIANLDTAEKWLTLPLVLGRLQDVSKAFGGFGLWKLARLDRNFGGAALNLMLPSGTGGATFHLELLNDLVNPRGGHSVAAETYAQAITKAVALRAANQPGNDTRGPNRSYYFISSQAKRGVNVVMNGEKIVLTVFYSSAATAWSTRPMTPEMKAERTIA